MSTSHQQQQPPQAGHGLGALPDRTLLTPYVLEPPPWRAPLIANKTPALYPDFFPGATALYPQPASQSAGHVPGVSRDSSAAASGSHFTPVAGVTASKEDELNETVAKLGFVNRAVVQTENFSAHALIHNKLHNGPSIHALGKIIQRVLERQNTDENLLPSPGPWTYKAPSRVVYNASRLEGWYADLANPSVPLSKLAKNIPSAPSSSAQSIISTGTGTYTGSPSAVTPPSGVSKLSGSALDKNLDMLITRQVPLNRALWFLQAVGQNDIGQLSKSKNVQIHPILSYSADFTVALVENLKRQIAEAVLPLTQTAGSSRLLPGMSVKGRPRNILAEEQGKDRWMAKWNYTLALLSASLDESMHDRQRLCSLLLQNLQPQTRIQMVWWLSVILQTTIDDMLGTAWMSKALVVILVDWLKSLNESSSNEDGTAAKCADIGRSLLRHIWLTDSAMFLIPQLWSQKADVSQLKTMLGIGEGEDDAEDLAQWEDLQQRAYILLCRRPPRNDPSKILRDVASTTKSAVKHSQLSDHWTVDAPRIIRILDGWEDNHSVQKLTEDLVKATLPTHTGTNESSSDGNQSGDALASLHPEVVKLMLMWATTITRPGSYRTFLAASILRLYAGLPPHSLHQSHHSGHTTSEGDPGLDLNMDRFEDLQNAIMDWIDLQEEQLSKQGHTQPHVKWTSHEATLHMCQILLSHGIFEISGLVQKVIARGHADVDNSSNDGIYAKILREYGGYSTKLALRWQMARISVSGRAFAEAASNENISDRCRKDLQPLLQRLGSDTRGQRDKAFLLDMQSIKATFQSLSVMKRAWTINDWLVPTIHSALHMNADRYLEVSTALSLLVLLETLEAYEAEAHFLNIFLRDFTTSLQLLQALVSVHRVNRLEFAALADLPAYASALLSCCQNLGSEQVPNTFVLAELATLALGGHLTFPQLHSFRRSLRTWQKKPALPAMLSSMLSPPENDNGRRDISTEVLESLQSFCHSYHSSPNTPQTLETTLVNLLSICGAPLDLLGVILPAMLQVLSDDLEENNNAAALRALCLAIIDVPVPVAARSPGIDYCPDFKPLLKTFTDAHVVFLQDLVIDNVISIERVLQIICDPLLKSCIESADTIDNLPALLNLLTNLLINSGGNEDQTWRICAARVDLYRSQSFPALYGVVEQLSHLTWAEDSTAWQTRLREAYQAIIAQSTFQTAFVRYILDETNSSRPREASKKESDLLMWDALSSLTSPWLGRLAHCTATGDETLAEWSSAILLLDGGIYTPFVSEIARSYLKVLLSRLDRVSTPVPDVSPANEDAARRLFAQQCLGHLLKMPENEYQEQLVMFSEYLGNDLLHVTFASLASELEVYSLQLSTTTGAQGSSGVAEVVGRLAQFAALCGQIWGILDTVRHGAYNEETVIRAMQMSAALLDTLVSRRHKQPQYDPQSHVQVLLVSRIVCLAFVQTDPASLGPEVSGSIASSLAEHILWSSAYVDCQYLEDILGWLLHSMSASSRHRVLKPYQRLIISILVSTGCMPDHRRKLLSLGPLPPLSCLATESARYLILRKTWAGLSVSGSSHAGVDPKSNSEPVDLLKYQTRTRAVDRHLQPSHRLDKVCPWQSFDFETPWDMGTTFQRDFRRSTITHPDFLPVSQAQSMRNRAASQVESRASQTKGNTTINTDSNKQQPGKEKSAEAQTREAPNKKRKTVPDVFVIEETSPKKKSKTTANVGNTLHAAKQSKNR